jgi:hypothetical protein
MKERGNMQKRHKKDPVKDFQKQCVDQKIDLFYVANTIRGILERKKDTEVRELLQEFEDECVHNIGMNALIERYEY